MRFFSFETAMSENEIKKYCVSYLEDEKHSAWNIFDEYTSARTGIHLYFTENGFKCYYENGERNHRTHLLQRAKTWASVKIKEKDGKSYIYGYTFFCPLLTMVLLLGLVGIIFTKDILAFALIFVICSVIFVSSHKEETAVIQYLKKIFQ